MFHPHGDIYIVKLLWGVMCFDRIEAGIDADAIQKLRVFCIVSLDVVGDAINIFLSFTYKIP